MGSGKAASLPTQASCLTTTNQPQDVWGRSSGALGRAHKQAYGSQGLGWAAHGIVMPFHRRNLNTHCPPSLQSTCDTMPNHSETISHTVNVPLQTALGTLEEIAC